MKKRNAFLLPISFAICLTTGALAEEGHDHGHDHGHEHGHDHDENAEAAKKGPHGGRLLVEGDFAVEISIFEQDAPLYRVYPFQQGRPLTPDGITAAIRVVRFGGKTDEFLLSPENDYLTSKTSVEEPHSFAVTVTANYEGKDFKWEYESFEGRTELSDEAVKVANLELDTAGPHAISSDVRVYGKLLPNENKVAHVVPRFPGIIKDIRKELGDRVAKNEVLAVVESNQSLQAYEIRSQVEGVVIKRHATAGEFVSETREIFIVADLSEIWADFQLYRDDFGPIAAGQRITVDLGNGTLIPATVTYLSPVIDEATQSRLIRAILPNPSAGLRPGLFVSAVLSSALDPVPVAVKREAIQTFRDWSVVYVTDGHVFQAMPVELGRKDSEYIEIRSGIEAGARYVSTNSFVVKADVEKSGASHDH